MDPKKTTPYDLYQYLLNIADADIQNCLLKMTFLSQEEIDQVLQEHAKKPEDRHGQKTLAKTMISMAHGKSALDSVLGTTDSFFSLKEDVSTLSSEAFEQHFKNT